MQYESALKITTLPSVLEYFYNVERLMVGHIIIFCES